jgi:hypothetical protein
MTVIEFVRSQEEASLIDRRGLLAIKPVVVDTSALVSGVHSLARGRDGTTVCQASAERPLIVRRPSVTRSLTTH